MTMKPIIYIFIVLCLGSVIDARHHHSSGSDELLPAVCTNGETMLKSVHDENIKSFEKCKYKREDALIWVTWGFDINNDTFIDMNECEVSRTYYFSWLELSTPFAETCDTVFLHCDCDGDGLIGQEDFSKATFTCLRDCKTVMDFDYYIKSRMVKDKAFAGKKNHKFKK